MSLFDLEPIGLQHTSLFLRPLRTILSSVIRNSHPHINSKKFPRLSDPLHINCSSEFLYRCQLFCKHHLEPSSLCNRFRTIQSPSLFQLQKSIGGSLEIKWPCTCFDRLLVYNPICSSHTSLDHSLHSEVHQARRSLRFVFFLQNRKNARRFPPPS